MFHPANIIVVAAGNVEHKKFVKLVNASLFSTQRSRSTASSAASAISAFRKAGRLKAPKMAAPIILKQKRDLEQAHMLIATPFVSGRDKRRYAADLLSDILGGGMSSRLWQKIREERGLAYSVGASSIMFNDCGMFMVSAGTSPEQTLEVVDIVVQEMRAVVKDGVTAGELELAKQQTRASVLLSLEDSAARSASLAQSEMLHGRQITLKESLANLDAVTLSDLHDLAREFFRTELIAFAALGNLKELKVGRKRLAI